MRDAVRRGRIVLVNGKAKVMDEALCDGARFCLPVCPTGALSVETREAPVFDEERAESLMQERGTVYITQKCFRCEAGEDEALLVPIRHEGKSLWVCTRCLPADSLDDRSLFGRYRKEIATAARSRCLSIRARWRRW